MRYRLIKPDWGKPDLIRGPNTIEGDNFDSELLKAKNAEGYNVYYFPNYNSKPLDHPYMRGADIDIFKYVFVDMDLKDLIYGTSEEFLEVLLTHPLKPNKIILSGNGVHAYWEVEDLGLESYLEIQMRLIRTFKTDESVWTALQLMRCSGTFNTKKQDSFKFVKEEIIHDSKFTVGDLKAILPELTFEDRKKINMHLNKLDGINELENLNEDTVEVSPKFIALLEGSRKIQTLWAAETGKRSEADYELACILFTKDFSKEEALSVLLNTNKALSKGVHRKGYAVGVVVNAYTQNAKFYVPNVAEKILRNKTKVNERGRLVNGPGYLDCLKHGWRTSEVLGLIGSSNSGKTTVTLDIFYNMIKNNPNSDDIFIFFSLEMEDYKIIEQWESLTFDEKHLSERLFVVSNEDEDGNSRFLNLQDVQCYVKDISKVTGKKVKAIAIDHVGIINKTVDLKRLPNFNLVNRDDLGFGSNRTLSERELTKIIKGMSKELDCFTIVQSQTTKDKAGSGDIELGLGAAYGAAQFEWDMDYVVTIWQPLKRVRNKTDLTITAFQYCKNRYINKEDRITVNDPRTLYIDLDTGRFRALSNQEFEDFLVLNKEASILRKMAEKKEGSVYKNSADIQVIKGIMALKRVVLHEIKAVSNS